MHHNEIENLIQRVSELPKAFNRDRKSKIEPKTTHSSQEELEGLSSTKGLFTVHLNMVDYENTLVPIQICGLQIRTLRMVGTE